MQSIYLDKRLVPRTNNELLQLNKNTNIPVKTKAKKQTDTKEGSQIANKHMKSCSATLVRGKRGEIPLHTH